MKAKLFSLLRPVLYACIGLSLVFACQKINPIDGVELVVDADVYKAPVSIRFVDGNSTSTKLPDGIKVNISGPGKDLVLNDLGDKDYTVAGSMLTLVLAESVNPSESAPVVFTVSASASGYVSTSKTITITDASKPLSYVVTLANATAPPNGTSAVTKTLSLTQGETLVVPSTSTKPESASITIPAGTQVKDANGNVINANTVTAQVVHFGTEEEESLLSFPGGFTADNITLQNGSNVQGTFMSAGFLAIDMTAGGKDVKSFSQPIEVKVGLKDDLRNPTNDQKVKAGDQIPTWSYDSSTGAWKEEGVATVVEDSNGKLSATFKASHLSYWNLDWIAYWTGRCNNRYYSTIGVSSNSSTYSWDYYADMYIVSKEGYHYFIGRDWYFNTVNGSINYIYNPPQISRYGWKLKIYVYSYSQGKSVGQSQLFDPCDSNIPPITVTLPAPPPPVKVDISFETKCANKNIKARPSGWVYLYDVSNIYWWGNWNYAYITKGKGNLVAIEGHTYFVYSYYAGRYYWNYVKFSKNTSTAFLSGYTGGSSYGDALTGQNTYDATTDKITLTATYTINNCK